MEAERGVTHDDLMVKLREMDAHMAEIHESLSHGSDRFDRIERSVVPLSSIVEAMGGEDEFQRLAVDAARGLAALAWGGTKMASFAKWIAVIAGGAAVFWAAFKAIGRLEG